MRDAGRAAIREALASGRVRRGTSFEAMASVESDKVKMRVVVSLFGVDDNSTLAHADWLN